MFTLCELADAVALSIPNDCSDFIISNVQTDSRRVTADSLFFALPGVESQGWDYLLKVIERGCQFAVVPENLIPLLKKTLPLDSIALIPSDDVINSLSVCLNTLVCHYPETLIAITGTNGKSSISYYIAQLARYVGHKSGLIGTFGVGKLGDLKEAKQTTPDTLSLHMLLDDFYEKKLETVAFEASSHALDQRRVDGVPFKCAVFTNLSRDHLDYHETMSSYAQAKKKIFDYPDLQRAVINLDDDYFEFMSQDIMCPIYSYSVMSKCADFYATSIVYDSNGSYFNLYYPGGNRRIFLPLLGAFNISNALAAIASLWDFVANKEKLIEGVFYLEGAPGRMQKLSYEGMPLVVVDYAHTPDALSYSLAALKGHTEGRIICVFGCGGDRDKGKRPLMTAAALCDSSLVWLTSDNPRTEDPDDIIADALNGLDNSLVDERLSVVVDRHQAIQEAISTGQKGDVILIAGKGHETYQDVMGVKHFFDDVLEAQKVLEKNAK
ncbi:UDP-N-acetylmuramoyl-L-alanyl-D-glutamate--2,6-diaminopimelate ligase [Marinomonas sp. 2405UD68-3]|uniref:UDP-N-acetylmuramoyl-L-alanyl-D-glutamate--2, 6-diaminopimelate ligase n=1 Tax=Marinomonas sp. 2405UD68-3 TaxID=3391835 RepID=UPI0039C97418